VLFDEDDLHFGGTPQSKFLDILSVAEKNVVESEMSKFIQRYAALEMLLEEHMQVDDVERILHSHILQNQSHIDSRETDIYIELVGNIVSRNG
jgi:hypothetical protein